MSIRIFTVTNPKQPVIAVCEFCGVEIKVRRHSNATGEQWVVGSELIQSWIDHQLDECKPPNEGVNGEGTVRG